MSTHAETVAALSAPRDICTSDEPTWRRLPPATLRAWHVDNAIGLTCSLAVLGLVAALGPAAVRPWAIGFATLAVLASLLESCFILPRRHRLYRYRVDETSIVVETGALVRRQLIVPIRQVLYVETHQGPVMRSFELTKVRLGTIADPKSVGPLERDAAAALRTAVEIHQDENPDETLMGPTP